MDLSLEAPKTFMLSALLALLMTAGALLILTPEASAERSDCPAGKICLWAGATYGGQQSFWNGYETGCHALSNIDPQSIWNHTGNHSAAMSGLGITGPGVYWTWGYPYTGELCIT